MSFFVPTFPNDFKMIRCTPVTGKKFPPGLHFSLDEYYI
jgi:hypothetical protein